MRARALQLVVRDSQRNAVNTADGGAHLDTDCGSAEDERNEGASDEERNEGGVCVREWSREAVAAVKNHIYRQKKIKRDKPN